MLPAILAAIFAAFTTASAAPLAARATVAHCGQSTGGDIPISAATEQAKNAPSQSTGGHSYPHEFKNYEGLPISSACQDASMMLELPVFADGHPYDLQNGENPGAARVIYSADNHAVCAIVHHGAHDSDFHTCS